MDEFWQDTLELVLKASNEGIWDWTVGSDEIYYSDRIYEFFGCEVGEAPNIMQSPEALILAEDAGYFANILALVFMDEDEELFAVDCRIRRLDGTISWLRIRAVVVREDGVAVRLVGSMIDISKRKRAEKELGNERTMLRLVVDNVPVQIHFKDVNSHYTLVNKRQAMWVGEESEEQMIGKSDEDYYTAECAKRTREDELRVMNHDKPILGEIQRESWPQKPDTYVQVVKQPWLDSRSRLAGTFGVSTDVTQIVQSQERLEEIALDLQRTNQRYQEELGLAREVQQALLPENDGFWEQRVSSLQGRASLLHKYIPATELAGDYYDVIPIDDGVIGVFICDVMGHGVRSALVVSMIRGLMEKSADYAEYPALFMTQLNKGLCKLLGSADINMFATSCYMVVDFKLGSLSIACAGHDFPLVVCKESGGLLQSKAAKGPALGFFDQAKYLSSEFDLKEVEELLFFTDGIYESAQRDGEDWGIDRFVQAFSKLRKTAGDDLLNQLCEEAQRWSGDSTFGDDVCLIEMKILREDT